MLSSTQPIALRSDENAILNVGSAKTPAASKPRRAFGDISNRKVSGNSNHTTLNKAKTPGTVLIKTTSKAPLQQLSTNKAPVHSESKPQQKRVEFILPGDTKTEGSKPEATIVPSTSKNVEEEIYPDIERPAGRLWSEQRAELDIYNGDVVDDGAPATELSFEGADCLRAEYLDCQRKRLQALLECDLENDEHCLQELYTMSKRVVESDGTLSCRPHVSVQLCSRSCNSFPYLLAETKLSCLFHMLQ